MSRLLVAALAVAALVLPAQASATLVFSRGVVKPTVWLANDDGSGQHRLVAGAEPHISADGQTVTFVTGAYGDHPVLKAIPAAGGAARTLLAPLRYGAFAWSPDGRWIAALTGSEVHAKQLVLVDVATGARRTLATGYFNGASFSPASDQLVYDRERSDLPFAASDLSVVPVDPAVGGPRALTNDHRSLLPVWGPTQIAFTHWARPTGRHRNEDGPKWNLALIAPDGSGRRALTHLRIPWLLTGLSATAWSTDGTKLLSQYGGQDTTYAVAVDAVSGAARPLGASTAGGSLGLTGTQLSADGSTVLGSVGSEDPDGPRNVQTIPWTNGKPTILVRDAAFGSWSTAP